MKKRAPATEAASPAGSAPPDCADSSTLSATLALPLAVTAASAEAMLALGAETVKGTWRGRVGAGRGAGRAARVRGCGAHWGARAWVRLTSTAAAACRRRPATAAGAPEMLTAHEAGKAWSRTSAACMMSVSAAPPGVPKAKAEGGCEVVRTSETSKDAGAGEPGAGAGAAGDGSE